MVTVTGVAQQQAWRARVLPPVERVRPGLWSIPVPIPDNPLRYVLVYALESAGGIALVDAGWPVPQAWDALLAGLREMGAAITDVHTVLITHIHTDHHGLSARIRAESGARVGMHADEAQMLKGRLEPDAFVARMRSWVLARGGNTHDAVALSPDQAEMATFADLAEPDWLIADGDPVLMGVRAVWTPGHTPGHLCFHDESRRVLLSGDHVLPRISPNISHHPGQIPDPLGAFAASLERVADLPNDEVLPAHEYRFAGLRERVDALHRHHTGRLNEVVAVLADQPGASTWAVAQRLTWARGWSATAGLIRRTALGETLAHLTRLATDGVVTRAPETVDAWHLTGRPPR